MNQALLLTTGIALAFATPAASAPPTISLQTQVHEVQGFTQFQLTGAVASARSGEIIWVDAKECGSYNPFHGIGGGTTGNGGTWVASVALLSNSTLRARWRGGVSSTIAVKVHPSITIQRKGNSRFDVFVRASDWFTDKHGVLERQAGNRWIRVRSFALKRESLPYGPALSAARFRANVRAGTLVRAVLPKSQTGACYLAGFSNVIKA